MTRLYFDHFPRTGGSAFCQAVRTALGPSAVVSGALGGNLSSVLRRFAALPAICGAIEYAPGDRLPADRLTATLLRDPLERVLSWYAFQRHDAVLAGAVHPHAAACRAMTLAECLRSGDAALAAQLGNAHSRHLARLRGDGAEPRDEARLLELALAALDGFDVVGVREALPEFADVVGARLGWGLLPDPAITRAASHPIAAASLDADTLQALRAANAVDLELHRWARARFARDRREAFRALVALAGTRAPVLARRDAAVEAGADPAGAERLEEFAASIAFVDLVPTLECGAVASVEVEVRNESGELWREGGAYPVHLSYHWLDAHGATVVFDGARTRLPFDLGPGDSVRLRAVVQAPDAPGRFVLRLGLLQELVSWFESQGSVGPEVEVDVITPAASAR